MTKKLTRADLIPFDVVDYLEDEQAIAEYLKIVMEENDPDALLEALNDVARARGMIEIARASGLSRESLYKTLRPGAKPRFETMLRIFRALGLELTPRLRPANPEDLAQAL